MNRAYKKEWCVICADTGIPIKEQCMSTLAEALRRYDREVAEVKRLFGCKIDAEKSFIVQNIVTGEVAI